MRIPYDAIESVSLQDHIRRPLLMHSFGNRSIDIFWRCDRILRDIHFLNHTCAND